MKPRRILFCTDFSENSFAARDWARPGDLDETAGPLPSRFPMCGALTKRGRPGGSPSLQSLPAPARVAADSEWH